MIFEELTYTKSPQTCLFDGEEEAYVWQTYVNPGCHLLRHTVTSADRRRDVTYCGESQMIFSRPCWLLLRAAQNNAEQ